MPREQQPAENQQIGHYWHKADAFAKNGNSEQAGDDRHDIAVGRGVDRRSHAGSACRA